jgi:hypothetical protein
MGHGPWQVQCPAGSARPLAHSPARPLARSPAPPRLASSLPGPGPAPSIPDPALPAAAAPSDGHGGPRIRRSAPSPSTLPLPLHPPPPSLLPGLRPPTHYPPAGGGAEQGTAAAAYECLTRALAATFSMKAGDGQRGSAADWHCQWQWQAHSAIRGWQYECPVACRMPHAARRMPHATLGRARVRGIGSSHRPRDKWPANRDPSFRSRDFGGLAPEGSLRLCGDHMRGVVGEPPGGAEIDICPTSHIPCPMPHESWPDWDSAVTLALRQSHSAVTCYHCGSHTGSHSGSHM